MNILINCSNLKKGGGLQVADSVCSCLNTIPQHDFFLVLSSCMDDTADRVSEYKNVTVVRHDIRNSWYTLFWGRDKAMDNLVTRHNIGGVLTIFGPARWKPKCKHLCGFARSHLVLNDSPYFQRMSWKELMIEKARNLYLYYYFKRGVPAFWTENPYISEKVKHLFPTIKAYTVSNYYNQVFDDENTQIEHALPSFDGCTLLSINAPYPHKNLAIAIEVARYLKKHYSEFSFRFVFTVTENDLPPIPSYLREHFCLIDKVSVAECPSLYRQADIMFQPTLLECFTATYVEAMRMQVPILTTDLPFAHGLCGNAAVYYSPLDAEDCAKSIYKMAVDTSFQDYLVGEGIKQLKSFDNYNRRAEKLIDLISNLDD